MYSTVGTVGTVAQICLKKYIGTGYGMEEVIFLSYLRPVPLGDTRTYFSDSQTKFKAVDSNNLRSGFDQGSPRCLRYSVDARQLGISKQMFFCVSGRLSQHPAQGQVCSATLPSQCLPIGNR
jgi:hypothetical protein